MVGSDYESFVKVRRFRYRPGNKSVRIHDATFATFAIFVIFVIFAIFALGTALGVTTTDLAGRQWFAQMLEYWMASNGTGLNGSSEAIEGLLQDPGSAVLFAGYPRWLLRFAAGCCVLFMLVGIPGNLITVAALLRTKKLRNATAIFIMNLSTSDLMFCCFDLPLATSTFWHGSWLHGPLLCRLFPFLRYGLLAVSLLSILSITINRYVMIGHPMLYPKVYKSGHLVPMVVATWFFGFGALTVTWFGQWGRFGLDPGIGSCSILPDANGHSPKEFLFVLAFLAPCVAIVVCYARIFYIVRRTATRSRKPEKSVAAEANEVNEAEKGTPTTYETEGDVSALGSNRTIAPLCKESTWHVSSRHPAAASSGSASSEHRDAGEPDERDFDLTEAARSFPIKGPIDGDCREIKRLLRCDTEEIPFADDRDECDVTNANDSIQVGRSETKERESETNEKFVRTASGVMREDGEWLHPAESGFRSESLSNGANSSSRLDSVAMLAKRQVDLVLSESKPAASRTVEIGPRMTNKDRKLLKMILVIFSSFLICYLPITITKIFKDAIDWRGLNIAGYVLIYLTTCINPVIYVVMSAEYRSAYKNVLLCRSDSSVGNKTGLKAQV